MINMTLDQREIAELKRSLENAASRLPVEIKIAVNNTSKKTTKAVNMAVRKTLNAKAAAVKKQIKQLRRATRTNLTSGVEVKAGHRLPLAEFKPNQTKAGVTYKIDKRKGRQLVPGGWMGPKPGKPNPRLGGHAFRRLTGARYPIAKLHGVSPWGVYVKRNLDTPTRRDASQELVKQLRERIRVNVLRREGLI